MENKPLNHEEADLLIAKIDLKQYDDFTQLCETENIKVLPLDEHDAEHPTADFLGLKNHCNDPFQALLRWREKPEGVPVKIKVPGETTLYVAKKGNYPFLFRERAC